MKNRFVIQLLGIFTFRLKSLSAASNRFPSTNLQFIIIIVITTINSIMASNSRRQIPPQQPRQPQRRQWQLQQPQAPQCHLLIAKQALFKRKPLRSPFPTLAVPREAIEGWPRRRTFLSAQSPDWPRWRIMSTSIITIRPMSSSTKVLVAEFLITQWPRKVKTKKNR